jgi:adenine-specific DNA-methyltransferase
MDVNYGKAIKQYLLDQVTLLRIHRFDPLEVQFDDALVSSAVVWFRKNTPPQDHTVDFTFGGTLSSPRQSMSVPVEALRHELKWSRFPRAGVREHSTAPTLGDFFAIRRGLATGDNKFFVLNMERAEALQLPEEFLTPILPSPRYMSGSEILADDLGNLILDRRLFLVNCRLPEAEIASRYPSLWSYLQTGVPDTSGCYLCRMRNPWYTQENRPVAPLLCTYMGRSGAGDRGPFRFMLNHSRAIAANVYLMLYPKQQLTDALEAEPSLIRRIWTMLNATCPKELMAEGRTYGGGLHKLEPKELANLPAEWMVSELGVPSLHQSNESLRTGKRSTQQQLLFQ